LIAEIAYLKRICIAPAAIIGEGLNFKGGHFSQGYGNEIGGTGCIDIVELPRDISTPNRHSVCPHLIVICLDMFHMFCGNVKQ
jgi:hypothetical protein